METLLDLLLAAGLVLVAVRAIHAPALFTAVVLYIAFGLLLSLVWVRLGAADLALAEAAIGAGVTGALLLETAAQLGFGKERPMALRGIPLLVLTALPVAGAVGVATFALAGETAGLKETVLARLQESGVEHPVTAVLLNFRGYDTWLEVIVLLAAVLGVRAITGSAARPGIGPASAPLPRSVAVVLPLAIVMGGYLLWRGTTAPGGAFQAGAVLGSAGILYLLVLRPTIELPRGVLFGASAGLGAIAFLVVGMAGLALEGEFLEYPTSAAGLLILLIELAVAISTAAALIFLFLGARPSVREERSA
jgi:multisubunit Na+/H+ antiporter MnhB subunit